MKRKAGLLALVSLAGASAPAHAYLDPGSVSLAIQAIVAALAGAALTWKHWYWRLRDLLGLGRKQEPETGDSGGDSRAPEDGDHPTHRR